MPRRCKAWSLVTAALPFSASGVRRPSSQALAHYRRAGGGGLPARRWLGGRSGGGGSAPGSAGRAWEAASGATLARPRPAGLEGAVRRGAAGAAGRIARSAQGLPGLMSAANGGSFRFTAKLMATSCCAVPRCSSATEMASLLPAAVNPGILKVTLCVRPMVCQTRDRDRWQRRSIDP